MGVGVRVGKDPHGCQVARAFNAAEIAVNTLTPAPTTHASASGG
ncbi:hypothetical protein GCM10009678_23590 [Actinomadura kijaniata]|uniref:Uncharacterized protein n=1 Tax=Actinomadura namibiensis TaxID=182080 RepID=A0A7W3LP00_ACTNM|nr:hypothetical protein [Actinomadura namibiensis]